MEKFDGRPYALILKVHSSLLQLYDVSYNGRFTIQMILLPRRSLAFFHNSNSDTIQISTSCIDFCILPIVLVCMMWWNLYLQVYTSLGMCTYRHLTNAGMYANLVRKVVLLRRGSMHFCCWKKMHLSLNPTFTPQPPLTLLANVIDQTNYWVTDELSRLCFDRIKHHTESVIIRHNALHICMYALSYLIFYSHF